MISLRNFSKSDAQILQKNVHSDMSTRKIEEMIEKWNEKQLNGRYFEMFAITYGETVVGIISLYQHTKEAVSIGPDIFPSQRRKGFAKNAMSAACAIARDKGYKIVSQQIRTDNMPSIMLHRSLGFETSGIIYTNQKGNECAIYLKSLI